MAAPRRHEMGAGGECICPKCETKVAHRAGVPCQDTACPNCGAKMLRVGSAHYDQWRSKQPR
mgnify:CR=1 FL=1